jgi:hypothetical protein
MIMKALSSLIDYVNILGGLILEEMLFLSSHYPPHSNPLELS